LIERHLTAAIRYIPNFLRVPFSLHVLGSEYTESLMQVVEVSTSKTDKHGHAKCHFVANLILHVKKLEDIVPSFHNYDVCTII